MEALQTRVLRKCLDRCSLRAVHGYTEATDRYPERLSRAVHSRNCGATWFLETTAERKIRPRLRLSRGLYRRRNASQQQCLEGHKGPLCDLPD